MIVGMVILGFFALGLLACAGVAAYAFLLMKKRPPMAYYEARAKQADFIPLSRIPDRQTELLVELEDSEFFRHNGFDPEEIRDAIRMNLRAKRIVYGGSSITMQLAKNMYFRFRRSFLRKAAEFLIARELERKLGKERILELYINIIYFGNGVYGISDAAQFYFHKPAADLDLNQMFILACLPAIPTRGNPVRYPEVFERVRNRRLDLLVRRKEPAISLAEADMIRSHGADCLDPKLRKPDEFTDNYPQEIPLINERFGPYSREPFTTDAGTGR